MTLSDVLSLLAIGVSIYAAVNTNSVSKHIANKTLQKEYFDKIIYVFLTIFLYLLKCPQSLIL